MLLLMNLYPGQEDIQCLAVPQLRHLKILYHIKKKEEYDLKVTDSYLPKPEGLLA